MDRVMCEQKLTYYIAVKYIAIMAIAQGLYDTYFNAANQSASRPKTAEGRGARGHEGRCVRKGVSLGVGSGKNVLNFKINNAGF